jgi:hypothetical protein
LSLATLVFRLPHLSVTGIESTLLGSAQLGREEKCQGNVNSWLCLSEVVVEDKSAMCHMDTRVGIIRPGVESHIFLDFIMSP